MLPSVLRSTLVARPNQRGSLTVGGYPSSEMVTDLYFIANYLDGSTLPPLDHWYPPHVFNIYYAFQHYGAALLGRSSA